MVEMLNKGLGGLGVGWLVAPEGDDKMPCCLLVMMGLVSVFVGFMPGVLLGRRTLLGAVRERWLRTRWVILVKGPCFSVLLTIGCVRSTGGGRVFWRGWEGIGTDG